MISTVNMYTIRRCSLKYEFFIFLCMVCEFLDMFDYFEIHGLKEQNESIWEAAGKLNAEGLGMENPFITMTGTPPQGRLRDDITRGTYSAAPKLTLLEGVPTARG